ncbi:hypothetical protein [Frankia sp. AgB32]|uniref:hypothetical protein n=1 Tax=Frankia sp. AgB32 TaxID=631119 RepID=UPI00200CF8E4|nr:hypothetical protein [Frankia sp. AgB32]MCK9898145.1 hypothetical protein [Frankia sp. AgB32]
MSETSPRPGDDRADRFVGGPGDGTVYGPDGKPWKPGDPIPARPADDTSRSGG